MYGNDIARNEVAEQLALTIRGEAQNVAQAGVSIIQVDEAALREGLSLQDADKPHRMTWALNAFWLATAGVSDETENHTHQCYFEFSDIIDNIVKTDADVSSIETPCSQLSLFEEFEMRGYPNDIGPGVYDIHSPACPSQPLIRGLSEKLIQQLPVDALWVNPDCGLKTRTWERVTAALVNMVAAAKASRQQLHT